MDAPRFWPDEPVARATSRDVNAFA